MTKKEMEREIVNAGGLTPKTALEISIKKWINLWSEDINENPELFPYTDNCALCEYYLKTTTTEACPLSPQNPCWCNNICSNNYNEVREAYISGNKTKFNKYKTLLIKEMQMALHKLELEESKKGK